MKKIYNTPKINVIQLQGMNVIADSGDYMMNSSYYGGDDNGSDGASGD